MNVITEYSNRAVTWKECWWPLLKLTTAMDRERALRALVIRRKGTYEVICPGRKDLLALAYVIRHNLYGLRRNAIGLIKREISKEKIIPALANSLRAAFVESIRSASVQGDDTAADRLEVDFYLSEQDFSPQELLALATAGIDSPFEHVQRFGVALLYKRLVRDEHSLGAWGEGTPSHRVCHRPGEPKWTHVSRATATALLRKACGQPGSRWLAAIALYEIGEVDAPAANAVVDRLVEEMTKKP
jgi:hypothetical protein